MRSKAAKDLGPDDINVAYWHLAKRLYEVAFELLGVGTIEPDLMAAAQGAMGRNKMCTKVLSRLLTGFALQFGATLQATTYPHVDQQDLPALTHISLVRCGEWSSLPTCMGVCTCQRSPAMRLPPGQLT